ncbi:hypothetical protein EVJ58_g6421 [Rhodofomes roseus]|uniref:Uncharacterized protein n=1 Tax=Rhodofomes roseus TaxID=34475 RepID=A0A4Y9YA32_9APHY|nr:hypothetical protein EVJ58_g6421 [Rhodofomes roseus]
MGLYVTIKHDNLNVRNFDVHKYGHKHLVKARREQQNKSQLEVELRWRNQYLWNFKA